MKDKLLHQKICHYFPSDSKHVLHHKHEAMVFSKLLSEQAVNFYEANEAPDFDIIDILTSVRLPYDKVVVEFELRTTENDASSKRAAAFLSSITLDVIDGGPASNQPTAIVAEVFIERIEADASSNGMFLALGKLRYVFPTEAKYEELVKEHLMDQYGINNVVVWPRQTKGKPLSLFAVPSSLSCAAAESHGLSVKTANLRKAFETDKKELEKELQQGATHCWTALCLLDFLNYCRSGVKQHVVTPKLTVKDKMNKGKRRGARRYTHVYLDKVEYIKNDAPVMRTDMQAHMVRGHFKRKKNGIFWWNPFVRGRGKLNKREAYIVKESADERSPVVVQQDQSVREVPEAVLSPQGGEGLRGAGDGGHALRHSVSRGL
jgi:hypothetical protein